MKENYLHINGVTFNKGYVDYLILYIYQEKWYAAPKLNVFWDNEDDL